MPFNTFIHWILFFCPYTSIQYFFALKKVYSSHVCQKPFSSRWMCRFFPQPFTMNLNPSIVKIACNSILGRNDDYQFLCWNISLTPFDSFSVNVDFLPKYFPWPKNFFWSTIKRCRWYLSSFLTSLFISNSSVLLQKFWLRIYTL